MSRLPSTDEQKGLLMSTDDTPRPESVTLTDEIAGEVWAWFNRHDASWSPSDATVNDLAFRIKGNVLAAREQALRAAIEADVLRRVADEVEWKFRSMTFFRGGGSETKLHPSGTWLRAEADRIEEGTR